MAIKLTTHTLDAFEVFPYEWDIWRDSTYVGTFSDSTFGDMIADCMREGINIVISGWSSDDVLAEMVRSVDDSE